MKEIKGEKSAIVREHAGRRIGPFPTISAPSPAIAEGLLLRPPDNDSAVKMRGEPTLKTIARELVDTVRRNTTIDWTVRENIRANLPVLVKRILRMYCYPPDKQEKATLTVFEQGEVLSAN